MLVFLKKEIDGRASLRVGGSSPFVPTGNHVIQFIHFVVFQRNTGRWSIAAYIHGHVVARARCREYQCRRRGRGAPGNQALGLGRWLNFIDVGPGGKVESASSCPTSRAGAWKLSYNCLPGVYVRSTFLPFYHRGFYYPSTNRIGAYPSPRRRTPSASKSRFVK